MNDFILYLPVVIASIMLLIIGIVWCVILWPSNIKILKENNKINYEKIILCKFCDCNFMVSSKGYREDVYIEISKSNTEGSVLRKKEVVRVRTKCPKCKSILNTRYDENKEVWK